MAHITDIRIDRGAVWARISETAADLAARYNKYRTFRNTLRELRALSVRELDDLGLAAADLRRVAYHATYN